MGFLNIRETQRLLNILDSFRYDNIINKLVKETRYNVEYCQRVIVELQNFLVIKVLEKDMNDVVLSGSSILKKAWSYLLLDDTSKYCSLCKSLVPDKTDPNDYIIHYNQNADEDYDEFVKRLQNTISNYKYYFGHDPPSDIWEHIPSASSIKKEYKSSSSSTSSSKIKAPKLKKGAIEFQHKLLEQPPLSSSSPPPPLLPQHCLVLKQNDFDKQTPSPTAYSSSLSSSSSVAIIAKKLKKKEPLDDSLCTGKLRVALLNDLVPLFRTDSYADFNTITYESMQSNGNLISCFNDVWYAIGLVDEFNNVVMSDETAIKFEISSDNMKAKKPIVHTSSDPDYKKGARGTYYFCAIDKCHLEGTLHLKFSAISNENYHGNKPSLNAETLECSININGNHKSSASSKRKATSDKPYFKIIKSENGNGSNDDDDDDDEPFSHDTKKSKSVSYY